jgi:hypothetical protein
MNLADKAVLGAIVVGRPDKTLGDYWITPFYFRPDGQERDKASGYIAQMTFPAPNHGEDEVLISWIKQTVITLVDSVMLHGKFAHAIIWVYPDGDEVRQEL